MLEPASDKEALDEGGTWDPFGASLLARSALARIFAAALGLVPLWLAVAWAVAIP